MKKRAACFMTAVLAFAGFVRAGESDSALEIRNLDAFAVPKSWRCEANVKAVAAEDAVNGHPALQLTLNIVHTRPDGTLRPAWPHAFLRLDPAKQNWSDYDNFEFQIHTTFNRSDETHLPFAVSVQNSEKKYSGHIELGTLEQNKWVKVSLPVAQFPPPHDVQRLGFHVSGAKYRDGDVLVVKIGEFRLTRAKTAHITKTKMLTPAIVPDAPLLAMELTVAGPAGELDAGLPVAVVEDGKPVWKGGLPVERGAKRYELDIAAAKLKPGKYRLVFFPDSPERKTEAAFTVATSPWDKTA